MTSSPIFIVGPPRSGTTLLAAMLNAHSKIKCGPETSFFYKLGEDRILKCIQPKNWPLLAVDALLSLTIAQQYVYEILGLTREIIEQELSRKKPSVRAMLEVFTKVDFSGEDKLRWAEKTPNHIQHLSFIREHFPDAAIIRIVRDPRDSSKSMNQLPWASDSAVVNAYFIENVFDKSVEFFEKDENCYTLKYEDLITNPKVELNAMCQFLNEHFEPEMLDTSNSAKSVQTKNEPWKSKASSALDPGRCYAYKKINNSDEVNTVSLICYPMIKYLNYPILSGEPEEVGVYPFNVKIAETNIDKIIGLSRNGLRVTPKYSKNCKKFAMMKIPDSDSLKTKIILELKKILFLLGVIIASKELI